MSLFLLTGIEGEWFCFSPFAPWSGGGWSFLYFLHSFWAMAAAPGTVMMSDCQITTYPRQKCLNYYIFLDYSWKDSNEILHIHGRQEGFFNDFTSHLSWPFQQFGIWGFRVKICYEMLWDLVHAPPRMNCNNRLTDFSFQRCPIVWCLTTNWHKIIPIVFSLLAR